MKASVIVSHEGTNAVPQLSGARVQTSMTKDPNQEGYERMVRDYRI